MAGEAQTGVQEVQKGRKKAPYRSPTGLFRRYIYAYAIKGIGDCCVRYPSGTALLYTRFLLRHNIPR